MGSPAPPGTLDAACINRAAFEYYGRLGRVKQYVDSHFTDDITLKVAADIACLEEKYFSNFFHAKTGLRFVDFVSYVRVEHAKQLIEQHDMAISRIAAAVGYHNRRSFQRAFKKSTGITPTEFKSLVRPC